jgi:hypothetical protein
VESIGLLVAFERETHATSHHHYRSVIDRSCFMAETNECTSHNQLPSTFRLSMVAANTSSHERTVIGTGAAAVIFFVQATKQDPSNVGTAGPFTRHGPLPPASSGSSVLVGQSPDGI